MTAVKSHLHSISLLRGLASLGVCLFHIGFDVHVGWDGILPHLLRSGSAGVYTFFVISGFVLPYSLYKKNYHWRDFPGYFLRRSTRIDIPLWACIILIFIVMQPAFSVEKVLLNITYLVPFVPNMEWYHNAFWTLSIEMQFYIMLGLGYPALMKCKNNLLLLMMVVIPLFILQLHLNLAQGIILNNLTYFCIGFILFKIYIKRLKPVPGLIVITILCIYVMTQISLRIGVFCVITVVILHFIQLRSLPLVFEYFSNISYSLYLVHWPITYYFVRAIGPSGINAYILYFLTLLACIVAATIFYWLVERPALLLSKKISMAAK